MTLPPVEWLTPLDAAREASRVIPTSASTLRQAANRGELPVTRTVSGRRLFAPADVRRWAHWRRDQRAPRP